MADETKIEAQAAAAAEAPAKVVEAVAATAEKVGEAAAKPVNAPRAKARKAKVAPKKTVSRRAAPKRRVKRIAKPAAPKIERTKTMTFDATKLFAFDALPGTDKFQTLFADAGERGQEIVKKSQKAAEELSDLAKANVEAFVEAGKIAVGGAKAIGQDVIASGREGIEQASDAVKTLAEAKSPAEFFQIQSELARASFDRIVAETSKLTERVVKLAGEAAQPLQTRASLNAERINTLVA